MSKAVTRTILLTFVISLFTVFSSFAREGMLQASSPDVYKIYKYANADESLAKNQWKQVWDNWYYFGEDGKSKCNTWAQIDGKWYYFDQWSIMLHDTTTPDGYYVGSDGVWDQDGQTKVEETKPSSPNDVIKQKEAATQQAN